MHLCLCELGPVLCFVEQQTEAYGQVFFLIVYHCCHCNLTPAQQRIYGDKLVGETRIRFQKMHNILQLQEENNRALYCVKLGDGAF